MKVFPKSKGGKGGGSLPDPCFQSPSNVKPTVVPRLSMNLSKMLARLISEDIELKIQFAPRMGNVFADPTALEQVLINLVLNARDAMPQGTLTIQGQNVRLDETFRSRYPYVKPGEYVQMNHRYGNRDE
jgi:hypothetical protein